MTHVEPQLTLAQKRLARFGIEPSAPPQERESATNRATMEWGLRCFGGAIVLFAAWMAAQILSTTTMDATVVGSRPVCSALSRGDAGGSRASCVEVGPTASTRSARHEAETDRIELEMAYRTPAGNPATFKQVLPKDMGQRIVGAGHGTIDYRPWMNNHAGIPIGSKDGLLAAVAFFACSGILLMLVPTFWRWREAIVQRWSGGTRPPPVRGPVDRLKIVKALTLFFALVIGLVAARFAFPAFAPYAKPLVIAVAIIVAIAKKKRRPA